MLLSSFVSVEELRNADHVTITGGVSGGVIPSLTRIKRRPVPSEKTRKLAGE